MSEEKKQSNAEKPISLWGERKDGAQVPFEDVLKGLVETPPLPQKEDEQEEKKPSD